MTKSLKILFGIVILLIYQMYITKNSVRYLQPFDLTPERFMKMNFTVKYNVKDTYIKYILLWTKADTVPFKFMGNGCDVFVNRNCKYTNCFLTSDRRYFKDYTEFDVIAFSGPQLRTYDLPKKRSLHQKYVFVSIESPEYYSPCESVFDNFFNWTWTYKLDSDSRWGYVVIKNVKGEVIGPKRDMHWMDISDMDPVSTDLKEIVDKKTKAVAWFVSNCDTYSKREVVADELEIELQKYNLSLDVYGVCGPFECPLNSQSTDACNRMLEQDYFFYLSFENSFAEDYVTEKLLHPLKNKAVPIVYGGANYTRFMPDGIYLDATKLNLANLAETIQRLINNKNEYLEYLRWRNHYSYHYKDESPETDDYCSICALINKKNKIEDNYKSFIRWWNPNGECNPRKLGTPIDQLFNFKVQSL